MVRSLVHAVGVLVRRPAGRAVLLITCSLWASGCALASFSESAGPRDESRPVEEADDLAVMGFLCPMHPDHTADVEGKCPRCGMALVRSALYEMRDYRLEFETEPALPRAGEPLTLRLTVFHPGTGEAIKKFELVHERPYHLFLISQDMQHFEHIHPEQNEDGTWMIQVVLPKPGYYSVLSDFTPTGGSSQFLPRSVVTAGYTGDLLAETARLRPDADPNKTVDDLTANISFDPEVPRAGSYTHLTLHLTHAATGQPVKELQPYLGAFGHMLIMSEDMVDYVHSHPLEMPAPDVKFEELLGGPEVIFEGLMPKRGRYRAWAQFRYRDKLYTFANTFEVFDVGISTR